MVHSSTYLEPLKMLSLYATLEDVGVSLTFRECCLPHASWPGVALMTFCQRRPACSHLVLLLLQQLLHLTEQVVALGPEL